MHKLSGKKAIIYIVGNLCKYGCEGNKGSDSYLSIRQSIEEVSRNPAIDSVLFYFDSPGGSLPGAFDTADAIASMDKPTAGFVTGGCGSAAYLLASQCDSLAAEQDALVGSIGVFRILSDTSKAAEMDGVKNILVTSGNKKGRLSPGIEIVDSDISDVQKKVDHFANKFYSYVQRGRNMSDEQITKLKDGNSYVAEEAIDYQLIDSITKYSDFLMTESNMKKDDMKAEETVTPDPVVEESEKEDTDKAEIEALKKKIQELSELLESMKKEQAEESKPEEEKEEDKKEEEIVAEESESEKDKEDDDEPKAISTDSYLLAAGNNKELAFDAMVKGWSLEKTAEKAESLKAISDIRAYGVNDANTSDEKLMATLMKECFSKEDAEAMFRHIKSKRNR